MNPGGISTRRQGSRFGGHLGLWLGLPSWLLLVLMVLPLVLDTRTLVYRDVLHTHLPLKAAQAQLHHGIAPGPLLDPFRGGGQPLLGNPNAVPFYPDNPLYRVAPLLWSLNAHFWLHWLLAPFAGYWLGRAWHLSRPGSWASGVAWATGGYVLSLLNLYNMVALAALAPALVAAFLQLARSPRPARLAVAALLTALTFLGGDPASAALVYLLAASAFLAEVGSSDRTVVAGALSRVGRVGRAAWAACLGLMIAAPVLVELLRALPGSYRGVWQYDPWSVLAQSWHPATLLEWWLPGFFGPLDPRFWGQKFFGGNPPFLSSLFPGSIVPALAMTAGFPRRRSHLWAWLSVLVGLFLALGAHNPVLTWAAGSSGFGLLRYPVKAWLMVALGMSLLAGLGFERLWRGARHGAFAGTLLVLAGASVLARPLLDTGSALALFAADAASGRLSGLALEVEIARWRGIWTVSTLVLVAAVLIALWSRRAGAGSARGRRALALLLFLHTGSQLVLLASLVQTDDSAPYLAASPVLPYLPAAADVVHGAFDDHFGPPRVDSRRVPDPSLTWWNRALFAELTHGAGIVHGLRYPFAHSPEGLDSIYAVIFAKALPGLDDTGRLKLLEAAGVGYLLLNRPLDAQASSRVVPEVVMPTLGSELRVYRLLHSADPVSLVTSARRAGSMTEARDALVDPSFDSRLEVVLKSSSKIRAGRRMPETADAEIVMGRMDSEHLDVTTERGIDAILVVRRAWLPIWRATVDGEPADIEIANGWQMAVAVPAGRHEVSLFVDRGPTRWAFAACLLALAILAALLLPIRKPIRRSKMTGEAQARGV